MADVFRNLKGTSKTEFRLGLSNRGSGLYSGTSDPSGSYTVSAGDIWFDKNNQRLAIRTSGGAWTDVTNTSVVDNQISSTLSSDVTFGADVTITGDLTVNGTQTVINTETLNIADNEIVLNSDLASDQPATANAGILVNRGNEGNVFLRWDEGEGEWTVNGETFSAGALIGNLSGNVTGSIAPNGAPNVVRANTLIVNGSYTMPTSDGTANQVLTTNGSGVVSFATSSTSNITEGTNLYFTNARADARVQAAIDTDTSFASASDTLVPSQLAVKTYVDAQVDTVDALSELSGDTDDVTEGSTNLYYTDARANSAIDAKLTGTLTLGEIDASIVSSPIFETVSDYGSVASSTTNTINYGNLTDAVVALVNSDYGVVESSGGPVEFPQYEVASVPDASAYTGHMIFVPNESGGAVMAFSDGTNWRRVTDRTVISS